MAGKSQYLETALLNWLKGTTFPSAPTTLYVALFTVAPVDDSGSGGVEVSGNNYSRASVTTSSGWSAISGAPGGPAQISNAANISFPTPSASWGTINALGIYDASTNGNLLYWNTITAELITSGQPVTLVAGNLAISDD